MAQLIGLDFFHAQNRLYHLYRLNSSSVAELPHYHNYYQVCFVLRGEIIHQQGNNNLHLHRGDAFVIPPGYVHSIQFAKEDSEIYSLSFSYSLFHPGFSQSNISDFLMMLNEAVAENNNKLIRMKINLNNEQRQNVQVLLECLVREQEANYSPGFSAAPSLIVSILYTLSRAYFHQSENYEQRKEIANYEMSLSKCLEYMDKHFSECITINDLCRQFAMSRSTFCMVFPQFTGVSFKQYLRNKRIAEAESLIASHPERSLGEIAQAVGYSDASTFYRNFIQVVGVSPTKYREAVASE